MAMAPGWYQDPFSSAGYVRWWDGERWGASTALPEGTPAVPPGTPVPLPPPGGAGQAPSSSQVPGGPPPPPASWSAPAPGQAYGQPYGAPAPAVYPLATWGQRAAARIIDIIITAVLALPFTLWLAWPSLQRALDALASGLSTEAAMQQYIEEVTASSLVLTVVSLVITFLYEVPQNVFYGRTIGKRVLGLRIRPRDEDRGLGWGQATIRWGTYAGGTAVVGGLFALIDYLWPLWDKPWRQAIHDKTARTTVVPYRA